MKKRFLAFTLAEVLVVLGIIGVVSALTLPNLNSSTNDKEKVAKVQKLNTSLQDAYGRATAVYGPVDEWFRKDTTAAAQSTRFAERMLKFMKPSKVCKIDVGCFSNGPLRFYDSTSNIDSNFASALKSDSFYTAILNDGTSVAFKYEGGSLLRIRVDIDGPNKGKNTKGVDNFDFNIILNNDVVSGLSTGDFTPDLNPQQWTGTGPFGYETAWVIRNGNMDYLKLDSSSKCPDGKELNWETKTTCK